MRYNTNKIQSRLFALATALIVMALVSACGGKTDRADGTDTVRLKRLSQIDSSIVKRVPNMETIVQQGMKNAKDSITYYEYYLRLTRIYWLSTEPERVDACVRRIEAYTGRKVIEQMEQANRVLLNVAEELKTTPKELLQRAHGLMGEMKELKLSLDRMKDKLFSGEIERCLFSAKSVAGLKVLTMSRSDISAGDLRKLGDQIRDREPDAVAVLAGVQDEKITLLAVCGKNAVAHGIKAGQLVKEVSAICGGSGGGKPDSAMGGGKNPMKLDNALAIVDEFVAANAK